MVMRYSPNRSPPFVNSRARSTTSSMGMVVCSVKHVADFPKLQNWQSASHGYTSMPICPQMAAVLPCFSREMLFAAPRTAVASGDASSRLMRKTVSSYVGATPSCAREMMPSTFGFIASSSQPCERKPDGYSPCIYPSKQLSETVATLPWPRGSSRPCTPESGRRACRHRARACGNPSGRTCCEPPAHPGHDGPPCPRPYRAG